MARLRWGIVGCGDIAEKRVANAIQTDENSELIAACRRDPNLLAGFCQRFQVPHSFSETAQLMDLSDVDAVYIATPVDLHKQNVIDAAARGKHVLVEKPMGISVSDCQEMIDACNNAGVTLSVAYYRRFYPIIDRMKELISSGSIGAVKYVTVTAGNPLKFERDNWRVVLSRGGGGPLMDIGSHRIDLLLDMFGPSTSVPRAIIGNLRSDYEAEDEAQVVIEHADHVRSILSVSFGELDVPDMFAVYGTDGALITTSLNDGDLMIRRGDGFDLERHPPHPNLHAPLIADFSDAVLSNRAAVVTGEHGREVNRVMAQAYESAGRHSNRV